MIRPFALLAALLAGTQAAALSCGSLPVEEVLAGLAADPAPTVMLYGEVSLDPSLFADAPPRRWPWQGEPPGSVPAPPVPARFAGVRLGPAGPVPFAGDLLVEPTCLGPDCGALGPGTWLLFADDTPRGLVVSVGACGGAGYPDPEPALVDRFAACLAGGPCR